MACWANVSNLRIADWAHDKIAVDWSGALRANAVVRQLVLTKGNIKVLLLAVNEVAAWTQNNVRKQTNNRNNRNDCPHPPRLCAAALSVANNVDDGKDIKHYDANDHEVNNHTYLRCNNLIKNLLHLTAPSAGFLFSPKSYDKPPQKEA
jgi:hypothetical protein